MADAPRLAERLALRRRPGGLPAGFQHWRRLLFVHWPLAPDLLRPLVPPGLSLDLYEGMAWVSLTPFVVQAARPLGAPRWLGLSFLETNVRTYVHVAGRQPGVYFFSLDAASLLAVVGARTTLDLPYLYAHGREDHSASAVDYRLRRCADPWAVCHARYAPGEPTGSAEPGSLDFFLIERYLLHVQRGRSLWTVQVHHRPYPLQRVNSLRLDQTLVSADGLPPVAGTPLAHFSPGVNVAIFPPRIRAV
jgi:uncharacterized protein YqjF (DUF2071 family)